MTQHNATVTIIVDEMHNVQFVSDPGQTERDAWRLWLGWPTDREIEQQKRHGWYAAQATLTWERP